MNFSEKFNHHTSKTKTELQRLKESNNSGLPKATISDIISERLVYLQALEKSQNTKFVFRTESSDSGKTCEACTRFDNRQFTAEEMAGAGAIPPLHPNCRCAIETIDGMVLDLPGFDCGMSLEFSGGNDVLLEHNALFEEEIRNAQRWLEMLKGRYLFAHKSGVYDFDTQEAVRKFQRDQGLEPNGILDTLTYLMLHNEFLKGVIRVGSGESAETLYNREMSRINQKNKELFGVRYVAVNRAFEETVPAEELVEDVEPDPKGEENEFLLNLKNDTTLGLSDLEKETFIGIARTMLDEGYELAFVAGMLANIKHEGGVAGKFESSAYISIPKPWYFKDMDRYGRGEEYAQNYSGKNIVEVNLLKVKDFVDRLEADNWSGGRFGLGTIQWTGSRTKDIMDLYLEVAGNKNRISFDEVLHAEARLIGRELSTTKKETHDTWELLISDDPNSDQAAYHAGHVICIMYEAPADKERKAIERGEIARSIYAVMAGK